MFSLFSGHLLPHPPTPPIPPPQKALGLIPLDSGVLSLTPWALFQPTIALGGLSSPSQDSPAT